MKRSSDQLRNHSRPSRAGNEIVLQIKKKPRSETLEEFQSRLSGQTHETIDEFKSRLSAKNTNESNRTKGINKNYSTVAKGNQNKSVWPKDEGNVSSDRDQREILDQLKREMGLVEAAKLLFEHASADDRAQIVQILSEQENFRATPVSTTPATLSSSDLADFRACAEAHPWAAGKGAPGAHIVEHFEPWFERGLTIEDIEEVQPILVAEYKKEIVRNTRKRIRALTKPHKLPAGAPRALRPSEKPVAELSPDELARRRLVERRKKARLRDKKQQPG